VEGILRRGNGGTDENIEMKEKRKKTKTEIIERNQTSLTPVERSRRTTFICIAL